VHERFQFTVPDVLSLVSDEVRIQAELCSMQLDLGNEYSLIIQDGLAVLLHGDEPLLKITPENGKTAQHAVTISFATGYFLSVVNGAIVVCDGDRHVLRITPKTSGGCGICRDLTVSAAPYTVQRFLSERM
jgi:hypothetical protein